MDDTVFESYRLAGEIAKKALTHAAEMVKPNISLLEVAETIEGEIIDQDAGLAFPLNISINEVAAHDTSSFGDTRVFAPNDVVKLDCGVEIEGYVADTARTVDLSGEYGYLVEATEQAIEEVIPFLKAGTPIAEISFRIQGMFEKYNANPVPSLSGHGLEQYSAHAPPQIPNIFRAINVSLKADQVIAIEPFATTGKGALRTSPHTEIYEMKSFKPVRSQAARSLFPHIMNFNGFPFAKRSLPQEKIGIALNHLKKADVINTHPPLHGAPGEIIVQSEHTFIIQEDGCFCTTN